MLDEQVVSNPVVEKETQPSAEQIINDVKSAKNTSIEEELKLEDPQQAVEEKHYIDTIKESSRIRYKYYGAPTTCDATIYADLRDNTISNVRTYHNTSIEDAHKIMTSKGELVIFWVLWILLTGGAVFGFVYIDNHWLEDRRKFHYEHICDRGYSRKQKSHSQFLQQSYKRDSARTGRKLADLPRRLRCAVLVRLPRQKPKA
jgi:hypothetical protein